MKGKQLTLDEVLELTDGSKVWVECSEEDINEIGIVKNRDDMCIVEDSDGWFCINDIMEIENSDFYVSFYEWIEEDEEWSFSKLSESFDTTFELGSYNIISMATEICNLRGIDLTDNNIDKIMKEFVIGENR